MNPRLVALMICAALMLGLSLLGITPAIMPGTVLLRPFRDRLAKEQSDPAAWEWVTVKEPVTLLDGDVTAGSLMRREVNGEIWYRRMTSEEKGRVLQELHDLQ